MEATWTKARKLRAVLSSRVAARRNGLALAQNRPARLRSLGLSVSEGRCLLRLERGGIAARAPDASIRSTTASLS